MFHIGGLKAPGPDGFPVIFFQNYWNIYKGELVSLVSECFDKGCIPDTINQTYISFIPKIPNAACMSYLRPISSCNTYYKVVSKVIVQRLRH